MDILQTKVLMMLNKSKFIRFLMEHPSDHGYTVDQSSNELNKSKFIRFLMEHPSDHGYTVDQSSNDADTLIVKH